MKFILLLTIPFLLLSLSACDPETGILTISGFYLYPPGINPKIGIFTTGNTLKPGSWRDVSGPGDASYTPKVTVVPDADGLYSIDFPEDISSTDQLILWFDVSNDGVFNMEEDFEEEGYFPVKRVMDTDFVITGWASIGDLFYAVYDDEEPPLDLSNVGTQGFDFDLWGS